MLSSHGPDKLGFGSDYAIWSPKRLSEKFMAYKVAGEMTAVPDRWVRVASLKGR